METRNTSRLPPADSTEDVPSPNILIVDDRKENLLATEKVLRNLPATLFKANSGNEALSLMLRHKFAVVLLDVQMPEMDGFETAALMQEDDSMQGTPIIFVTAISKEEKYASQAAEIGAVDYIFKPINSDILRSKVKVYLDLYVQREQILRLNAGLRQSNEELERFAYICSHDLKSPLRAIDNLSQWIVEDMGEALQGKSRENMEALRKRVLRMEKLLDDTLEYARIGAKIQSGASEIVNGRLLMENVVALAAPPETFTVRIGDGFAGLNISRLPLQQVLYNLVNNAVKHHDGKAGTVLVDVEEQEYGYAFSVRDDGPGIAPQYHQKIFEMFQTLKPRDQKEGSGMGLAIVKKILVTCGGEITLDSEEGKGGPVPVYLAESGKGANRMISNPRPDAVSILVVEDDEIDFEVTRRAFKKHSLKNPLYHARCGTDALEILHGRDERPRILHPCIMLVDINMPQMNGLEFLTEIRRDETLKKSVAFILTTSQRDTDIEAAYALNAAGYFLKENIDKLIGMLGFYREINRFSGE